MNKKYIPYSMRAWLKSGLLTACSLLLVLAISPASAAAWNYGTTVRLNSDWNDNIALADDALNPQSSFRLLAAYEGEFERQGAATKLSFQPRVTTDYYPDSDNSDLQATDFFLPGSYSYQRPHSLWSLGFSTSRQSVLSDEATTSQETIGARSSDETLTQYSISPTGLWRLSEKDELQIAVNYGASDYSTNRSETDSIGANLSYSRDLDERNTIGLSGSYNSSNSDQSAIFFDPPTSQFFERSFTVDSTSSFVTADYDYALTEASSLKVSYGIQEATTETDLEGVSGSPGFNTGSLSFNSSTYNVSYRKDTERTNYNLTASRIVTLDITNGQPQDRYQLAFDGNHQITKKLTGGWRVLAWEQEAVALQAADQDNVISRFSQKLRYASAAVSASWNITRKWYLDSRYEYRRRETDISGTSNLQDQTATSNQITLGISYVFKEIPRR